MPKNAVTTVLEALRVKLRDNPEGVSLGLLLIRVGDLGKTVTARGLSAANERIAQLEEALRESLRQHDMLVRLSDDKFAAVMVNLRNQGHLSLAANKLLRISESTLRSTPRIGMALASGAAADADELLRAAESALLVAQEGPQPCRMFDAVLSAKATAGRVTRENLEDALNNNQLDVYYQPKVSARDHAIVGAEALMRWLRTADAAVSPDVFVPLADRGGLIDKLTWHALTVATRQASAWTREFGNVGIAVNVTPNVIEHHDLPALVANALGLWGLPPHQLTIEITESALTQNPARCNAVLKDLRSAGVKVSLDDFGTGYSSLSYFKNMPADELKIGRSFVLNMLRDPADRQLVHTIVGLAHTFGLTVTAVGVENAETAALLADIGCDFLQGYHFSKPAPAASMTTLLGINQPMASAPQLGKESGT